MKVPGDKAPHDPSGATVFARQVERAALVPNWLTVPDIGTVDRILDVAEGQDR